MIKHFGNPPETETPPALEPKRSNQAIADQLIIRMKKLETQQRRTLVDPLLPSAPQAETGFSNIEYESQPLKRGLCDQPTSALQSKQKH